MCSDQSNTSIEIRCTSTWVEFEDDPFAHGASRDAYKGTFHGDPRLEGKPCVVKVYNDRYKRLSEYAWKAEGRAFRKADDMAQLFNNKYNTSKPIQFSQPEFTRVGIPIDTSACFPSKHRPFNLKKKKGKGKLADTSDRLSNIIPKNTTIAVERYLEGEYVKFNSNTGYVNPDDIASPKAFSHFSYNESKGEVLVCDLQGVRTSTGYMFSDPAVLSGGTELGVYGPTDLGKFGIVKFFENHTCNYLCKGLKKPKIANDSSNDRETLNTILDKMPMQARASSYTSQLSFFPGKANELQNKLKLQAIIEDQTQPTVPQKDQSNPQKDQSNSHKDQSNLRKDQSNPGKGQSIPQKGQSNPQTNQSIPMKGPSNPQKDPSNSNKDQSIPQKGQSNPQTNQSIPKKGQSNPQKDPSNSNKDQTNPQKGRSNPQKGQSNPQTNQSTPKKGQSNPQKDQSNAHHDQSNPQKDQPIPQRDQSIPQKDQPIQHEYQCSTQTNQSIPQKDQANTHKDQSNKHKDQSNPQKDQAIPQRDQSVPQKD